jgi:hypothetical protein
MASIPSLVRPAAAFDPETIAVRSAALDETWVRLLRSGSECTQPAYAPARGDGASHHRWRKGHWRSKRACRRRGSISRCKLSTWAETPARFFRHGCRAGGACRDYGCRQRRLPASAVTMAWSSGNIAPLRGFRPPHMALRQIGCPGAIRSCSGAPILSRLSSGLVATCL